MNIEENPWLAPAHCLVTSCGIWTWSSLVALDFVIRYKTSQTRSLNNNTVKRKKRGGTTTTQVEESSWVNQFQKEREEIERASQIHSGLVTGLIRRTREIRGISWIELCLCAVVAAEHGAKYDAEEMDCLARLWSTSTSSRNANEAKVARKLLEICSNGSVKRALTNMFVSSLLSAPHPQTRAVGLDAARALWPTSRLSEAVTRALLVDAEGGRNSHPVVVDAAVRTVQGISESFAVQIINDLERQQFPTITRVARRLGVLHLFPTLAEAAEARMITRLTNVSPEDLPRRVVGHVTQNPTSRINVVRLLGKHAYHLTGFRLLEPGEVPSDFGLNEDEAKRELERRREKYVSAPPDLNVRWIGSEDDLEIAIAWLNAEHGNDLVDCPIGIDVEWHPALLPPQKEGNNNDDDDDARREEENDDDDDNVELIPTRPKQNPAEIVQLCVAPKVVFVVDLRSPCTRSHARRARLDELLCNLLSGRRYVGFGLNQDLHVLRASLPGMQCWEKMAANFVDLASLNKNKKGNSLNSLAQRVLGKGVDKEMQMSEWKRRPLRTEQLEYAALDAYVLVLLDEILRNISDEFKQEQQQVVVVGEEKEVILSSSNDIKFAFDERLLRLCKMLRAAGFDAESFPRPNKGRRIELPLFIERAMEQGRVFVTDDLEFVTETNSTLNLYVLKAEDNDERFRELVKYFHLDLHSSRILLRCTRCNASEFLEITKDQVQELPNSSRVPEGVLEQVDEYWICSNPQCAKIVWRGGKFKRVVGRMTKLLESLAPPEPPPSPPQ